MNVTADNITDEQIRDLRERTKAAPRTDIIEVHRERLGLIETCDLALGETLNQRRDDVHAFARARCAEIINARIRA